MRPPVRHSYVSAVSAGRVLAAFTLAGLSIAGSAGIAAQAAIQDAAASSVPAETATQAAMTDALNALQPLLPQVSSVLGSVDVHRWKAPNEVKDTTSSDIQSIQKDLNGTLPGLINQAQAAPSAIGPGFAVFRNIDALYDVLLRITETATLAGSQQEASKLEDIRSDLQTRRGQLGNAILASASAQDTSVSQLQASLQTAKAAAASQAAPKKVVVDDGPDSAPARPAHKRKPAAPRPATSPTPPPSQ